MIRLRDEDIGQPAEQLVGPESAAGVRRPLLSLSQQFPANSMRKFVDSAAVGTSFWQIGFPLFVSSRQVTSANKFAHACDSS